MPNFEKGPQSHKEEQKEDAVEILDTKVGDIINVGDKKVKLIGFSAPEGNPGRALMYKELTEDELKKYQQREDVIAGKIKQLIESNPNAIVDEEQAKKYWGRIYDEADKGSRAEMQFHEIYAQKYEESARYHREKMLELEESMKSAKDEAERQIIQSKIIEQRESSQSATKEASLRRSYNNPEK